MNMAPGTRTEMEDRAHPPGVWLTSLIAVLIALLSLAACDKKESGAPQSQPSAASSGSVATAGPWRLELKTVPDRPSMAKPMTFTLHITDDRGQPVNDATVHGALTMKLMDMGTTPVNFSAKGNGDYEASVKSIDMSGPWNLAIDVAQGGTHAKKDFEVTISD